MTDQTRSLFLVPIGVVSLCLASCGFGGGDAAPTTPTLPTISGGTLTPTAPSAPSVPSAVRFELSSEDGAIAYSAPLTTLGADGSFELRFRPREINRGNSGFSNVVEFWLDKGPEESGVALGFGWMPDSRWRVYSFTESGGFDEFRPRRQIDVNGRFRTITVRRRNGSTEWFLDDRSLVVIDDPAPSRTVYVRVVGTRAEFQADLPGASPARTLEREGSGHGAALCGLCQTHMYYER